MSRQMCQQVLGPPETVGDFCPPGAPLGTAASMSPAATVVPPSASWRAGLHEAPPVHPELPPQAGQPQKRQTATGRGRKGRPGQEARPSLAFPAPQAFLGSVLPGLQNFQTPECRPRRFHQWACDPPDRHSDCFPERACGQGPGHNSPGCLKCSYGGGAIFQDLLGSGLLSWHSQSFASPQGMSRTLDKGPGIDGGAQMQMGPRAALGYEREVHLQGGPWQSEVLTGWEQELQTVDAGHLWVSLKGNPSACV